MLIMENNYEELQKLLDDFFNSATENYEETCLVILGF